MSAMRMSWLAALVVMACSSNDDIPAPQLGGIVPSQASPGAIVSVDGSYLCQEPMGSSDDPGFQCDSDGIISFDQTPAVATSAWTDNGVMVEVPTEAAGVVQITASQNGRTSNSISFTLE